MESTSHCSDYRGVVCQCIQEAVDNGNLSDACKHGQLPYVWYLVEHGGGDDDDGNGVYIYVFIHRIFENHEVQSGTGTSSYAWQCWRSVSSFTTHKS